VRTTFPVAASPEAWAVLSDPEAVAAALAGCRSVTRDADGDGTFRVVTDVAVASVRGLWSGTVVPVDADAVRIVGSGAPGTIDLVVRADPDRTALTVDGTVEGPLATVGSTVLAAAVRRTAEALLSALAAAPPSRGDEFRSTEPEVMDSGSGTHRLIRQSAEPITSGQAAGPGRRVVLGGATLAGVVAVLVVRRRRRRRSAREAG
jgi:carbon monoxide dehydrogenase subunit G